MDLRAILMGLGFALMWSSAFTSARIIVAAAPPLMSLSLRFLLSGLIAIAIARAVGQSWKLTPPQWRATILFGICQNTLYLGLNFVAMQWIEASLAAIIASTLPLLVAAASVLFLRERLPVLGLAGLVAGFAGVSLIMGARLSGEIDGLGVLFCILGAIALAYATLAVRGLTSGGNVLMVVGLQMLVGSVTLGLVAPFLETFTIDWSWQLVVAFLYTTLVPGLAATWVWFTLVNRVGATRAAAFHFLNPFFGVAIAAVILSEPLSGWDLIGVAIIMAGILAVQISRRPAR